MRSNSRRGGSLAGWGIPLSILLLSWLIFCNAAAAHWIVRDDTLKGFLYAAFGFLPLIVAPLLLATRRKWWPRVDAILTDHTLAIDNLSARHMSRWIALAAGLGLYLELVLIRYHGTCFAIFGFFKNLSMLSCFLGLGVGYALGRSRLLLTPLVLPALALQLITMHFMRYTDLALVMQNPVSEQLAMGLKVNSGFIETPLVYGFVIWVFSLNAACLIPLGQLASRLMGRSQKLSAYSWNLLGSVGAVVAFWGLSFLWTGPNVWFAIAFAMLALFLRGMQSLSMVIAMGIVTVLCISPSVVVRDYYSPYQILSVFQSNSGETTVQVNHFFFQTIFDLRPDELKTPERVRQEKYYGAPYAFHPRADDVLVVGAGTGNDVAAALRHSALRVDADEIDPAVVELGGEFHPEAPYFSDRVTVHVQDARAFIRNTSKKYDLIVYGLLDSHTSLSGMSGVRLDSYIYTVEALKSSRAHLKDDGIICLSFAVINKSLGSKLLLMLHKAFPDSHPKVFNAGTGATIFVVSKDPNAILPDPPDLINSTSYYEIDIQDVDPSTDDWPFFYMPHRTYPVSYCVMIAFVMAAAVAFIRPVVKLEGGVSGISGTCFLLGAGFMLLETKAITELALYYGSTWIVISIVILAILIMAFLSNLVVMRFRKIPLAFSYGMLLASLAFSLWFSSVHDSISGEWTARLIATAVITLPLFFSGLVFSAEFDAARSVSAALGSNLIGAMLGGCLEYNSMYFGYRSLYVLAIIIYALSMVVSMKSRAKQKSPPPEIAVAA